MQRRSHDRLRELLSAYVDGELSVSESRQVESHLAECGSCREELDTLRMTVSVLRGLPQLEAPRSFALKEAPRQTRLTPPVIWTTRLATSVAAVMLVALLLGDALGLVAQSGPAVEDGPVVAQFSAAPEHSLERSRSEAETREAAPAQPQAPAPAPPAAPAPAAPMPAAVPAPAPTGTPEPIAPMMAAAAPAQEAQADEQPRTTMEVTAAAEGTPTPESSTDAAARMTVASTGEPVTASQAPEAPPDEEAGVAAAAAPPETAARDFEDTGTRAEDEELSRWRAFVVEDEGRLTLPLRQLQIALGALVAALLAVSVWTARRAAR